MAVGKLEEGIAAQQSPYNDAIFRSSVTMRSTTYADTSFRRAATTRSRAGDRSATVRGVILIASCLLLIGLGVGAIQLYWAREHLVAGSTDLRGAIDSIRSPGNLRNLAYRQSAVKKLRAARAEFGSARNDLSLWSPVLGRTGWVPGVGSQLESAAAASSSAYYATSSALDMVDGAKSIWPAVQRVHHTRPLLARLEPALARGHASFVHAEQAANEGLAALRGLPASTNNPSLNHALARLRLELPRLKTASMWLSMAPTLLGNHGPRRYLIALENSAEIRPTGGFMGAADLLTVRKGYIGEHFTGASLNHEISFPHLPVPEAELTNESDWLFRDSNFSPDYPTSARLERWFFGEDTRLWANGVVDFVDGGVSDLLQKLGPLYIPQYHVTVTAQNAKAVAQTFAAPTSTYNGPSTQGNHDTVRKQFLGFELAAMLRKVQSLPQSKWSELAFSRVIAGAASRSPLLRS